MPTPSAKAATVSASTISMLRRGWATKKYRKSWTDCRESRPKVIWIQVALSDGDEADLPTDSRNG